ncbi:MAG: glutamine--tRNA ligase/YqeY domain fusion protein [Paludibacteraceae bacterium]|nr:glutamine--tRNA ligase/YqeY domain fusion protein [Paludibacteraceae bacterium]
MENEKKQTEERSLNFIEQIVEKDLAEGVNNGRIQTRFPPEPNGYLHIGHVKAICMDFGIAEKYNGVCNLRFDDTNPVKEDTEYVETIERDIRWLGFKWGRIFYASDYFEQLYDLAIRFIKEGKAYVDEQTAEQIAEQKGTPTEPGVASPFRDRPVEENLRLFEAMQAGEIEEGKMVLRAKIDMANPNMHFRDPIIYRIITSHPHHRTGHRWNVYPMYDFAHGQSDYFEGVTHSICTLEFEVHRPLYDWFIDQFSGKNFCGLSPYGPDYRPKQREFNRLNITYTVMSKRKMLQLVKEGLVAGWDDPRMPTVCGLRRRGYTPTAIRSFMDRIGYTKVEGMIDQGLLEHTVREDLKEKAPRVCAIFDPVKLVITNYEGEGETIIAENIDGIGHLGTREMRFGRELWIERGDFLEEADNKFYRLSPGGREVRLKSSYIIQATGCEKDGNGNITTVYATYDPASKSGTEGGNRKTKATINWVECSSALDAEVRLYDRLFAVENPSAEEGDFRDLLNPDSLKVVTAKVEGSLRSELHAPVLKDGIEQENHYQLLKQGYFVVDPDTTADHLVLNRTCSLKDNYLK